MATKSEKKTTDDRSDANVWVRTERVVLIVTHYDETECDFHALNWDQIMADQGLGVNKSFRVIEERDAAIRRTEIDLPPTPEPSVARVTLEFIGGHRAHPTQWPWDLILSGACVVRREPGESVRVVEEVAPFSAACPIAGGTVKVDGKDMVTLTEFLRHTTKLTQEAGVAKAERDAAIRERDELRDSYRHCRAANNLVCDERDALKARVAELESQLESVADRAAAAETSLEAAPAASGGSLNPHAWGVVLELHDAAREVNAFGVHARLEKAMAAAERLLTKPRPSAPAASGWLTPEEREMIEIARNHFDGNHLQQLVDACTELLARSTPPEVVRPKRWQDMRAVIGDQRDAEWLAALDAAGVPWKEVGN